MPQCLGDRGPQHFRHTRKCWGVEKQGHPESFRENNRHFRHTGACQGEIAGEHMDLIRVRIKGAASLHSGRESGAERTELEKARRRPEERKALCGQDFKGDVPIINDQPLCCTYCSAALSPFSTQCQQKGDVVWRCDFCYKHNQSSGRICGSPNTDVHDVIYLSEEEDGDYVNLDDLLIVFCVDISGSMCVTTKSVQDAIQNSLSFLLKTYRHRRVALVTFNDKVTVYGDGMVTPLMLSEWGLMDYTFLKSQGENFTTPHCIAESVDNLRHKVQEMREYGPTALGPAALVSIALASRYSGSKVIICTDGLANIGLGYLNPKEEAPSETATYFYKSLAEEAVAKGVIVSVLTFEGTDCRLSELGQLADRTGGRVNIVNINNLSSEIQIILEDNVVATDVRATLFLPEGMYFRYEDHTDHKLLREIGNVTDDLEVTFEFGIKESSLEAIAKREKVPFQLLLSYKTRDLQRATRIITMEKNVILTSFLTEDNLNMEVLKVHFAQLSARLTMQGRVKEAQQQVLAQQELLRTIGRQNPINTEDDIYENWMRTMAVICNDLTKTTEPMPGAYYIITLCKWKYPDSMSPVSLAYVDECSRYGGMALCQQLCKNMMGSFRCQCYPGYQLSANGRSCVIVPLILEPTGCGEYGCDLSCSPSGCEQISRVCPVGFIATETSSHVTCTDIDECAGNHSPCQHRCQNSVGSYKCSCRPGFYLHANGYTCIDFNECQRKRDKRLCQQSCQNTIGSFTCFCRPGYRLSADRVNCEDVDECREDVSLCPGRCRNTRGSYRCSCPEGFTQVGNNCQDINECHLQPSRCMHHCENLIGSYRCACPVGYRLLPDGKRCEDVNECAQPNASHCTHSCINTIGSYLCGCHHGYRLHIDKKSCIVLPDSILEPSALLKSMPYLKINKLLTPDSQMKITGPPTSPPPSDPFSTLQSASTIHLKLQKTSSDFLNVQTKFRTPVASHGRPTTYKTQPTPTLENAGKGSKQTTLKSLILQDEFIDPPHTIRTKATDHHIHLTKEPVTQVVQKSFLASAPFHTAYIIHPTSSTMTSNSPNGNILATVSASADKQVTSSTLFIFEDVKSTLKAPSRSQDPPIHPSTLSKAQTKVISPVTSRNILQNSPSLTDVRTTLITPLTTQVLPPNLPIVLNIQDSIAAPSSTQNELSNTPTMFKASATSPLLNNVQVTLNAPLMSQGTLKNLPIVMDTQSTISNPSTSEDTPSNTLSLVEVQATLATPPASQRISLNPTTLYNVQATLKASHVSQGTYPNLPVVRHVESTNEVPTLSQDITSDPLTLDNGQSTFMTPTMSQDASPALPVIMHVLSTISADPMDKVMTSHSLSLHDVFTTPSTGQAMPPHSPISLSDMQTTPTSSFSLEEGLEISPTGQNSFRTLLHLRSTYTIPPALQAMLPNPFIDYEDSFIHPTVQSKLPSPLPLQAALKSPNTWHTSTGLPALIEKSRTFATVKSTLESPTSTQAESKTHLVLQKTSTNHQSSRTVSPSTQHTAFTPVTIIQPNSHPTVSLIMRTGVPTLIGSSATPSSATGADSTTLMSSPSVLSQRSPLSSNSDDTPSIVLTSSPGTSSVLTVSTLDYMGLFLAQKQSQILKPSSYIPTKTRSETSPTESSKPPPFNYKFPSVSPDFQRSDLKTTASMSSLNSSPVNKQSSTRSNVAITHSDTSFSRSLPSRPTLKPEPAPIVCLHNGVLHPEGNNWLESQCKNCTCLNDYALRNSCMLAQNYSVLMPYKNGCSYHGLIIENEETFSPEEDNCTLCLCLLNASMKAQYTRREQIFRNLGMTVRFAFARQSGGSKIRDLHQQSAGPPTCQENLGIGGKIGTPATVKNLTLFSVVLRCHPFQGCNRISIRVVWWVCSQPPLIKQSKINVIWSW
ncbi:HMCN1 protein, partial [Polypterus senegalus]